GRARRRGLPGRDNAAAGAPRGHRRRAAEPRSRPGVRGHPRQRLPRPRRGAAAGELEPRRLTRRQRPGLRLRRDLVDTPVPALLRRARAAPGPVTWLDARRVIVAEWGPLGPGVQWPESQARLREAVPADCQGTLVITGFIAADARGVQTTLGRNGSDFSASIFGAHPGASEIQIWTDVDGVMSADPRRVPDATVIDALSYNEAMELAYFGAKVIHPQTMAPAVKDAIPIWIRNTFAPEKAGTLICAQPTSALPIKGITSIERVALVNLEGTGMIGVPGTAHRLFGALREEGISVILISQGSSEHSICCAIPQEQAQQAAAIV